MSSSLSRPTPVRLPRRFAAAGAALLMAVSLGSASGPASASHTHGAPGPIHAGNTFGWYGHGGLVYDETFVGPLNQRWRVEGPGQVRTQHGMLTLNTANKGRVSARRCARAARTAAGRSASVSASTATSSRRTAC